MVITPSLPTFSIASAINWPTFSEPDETAATCAIASFESTTDEILCNSSTAVLLLIQSHDEYLMGWLQQLRF